MNIQVVVMAAGESQRFGSPKQLAMIGNQCMIAHVLGQIKHPLVKGISVALGSEQSVIEPHIPKGISVISVSNWQMGIGATIQQAVTGIADEATHVLLIYGDQVGLTCADIDRLLDNSCLHPLSIISSYYAQTRGLPVIIPADYFSELMKCTAQSSLELWLSMQENVTEVTIPHAETDIDTPEQLAAFVQSQFSYT